jgi:mediator of RNA polymerase II transcription subunit 7
MANPEAAIVSSFPLPPSNYIKNYTNENVLKGNAPKPPTANIENYTMFG